MTKFKKRLFGGLLAAVLIGSVALAGSDIRVVKFLTHPVHALAGLYVGPAKANLTNNTNNKITAIRSSGIVYITMGQNDGGCAHSTPTTVLGAQIGDVCLLGKTRIASAPTTGGLDNLNPASVDCEVSDTNTVKLKVCVPVDGAGNATAVTVTDAGVNFIVISNQAQ